MQDTTTRQLIVGYTPTVYRQLGMPSLPLTIGSGHVYSAAKTEAEAKQDGNFRKGTNYHGLGDAALKNIYKAIQDPVMVIAAKDVNKNVSPLRSTHSVVAIVDIGTAKKSLLVPIEITAERTVNGEQMDVNTISSVYEKSVKSLVAEAIAQENAGDIGVYYAKKEALTLPAAGVQFPARLQQSIASDGIVHRFSEKVNMKISSVTQSQQFKRWFGDWQNDPANASKVVNAGAGADRAEPADHLLAADQERQREIPADAATARQGSDPARACQPGGGGKKFLRTLQRLGNAAGGPVAADAGLFLELRVRVHLNALLLC